MSRLICALVCAFAVTASAQDAYPSKPITMVVPFPPGGVADIVGRPLAAQMEKTLKQPVVVVNRTGAGGAVGMAAVAKAAPDGYTILMGLSSISIFPVSDRINGKTPSYEMTDFAPIALITADPTVLVVSADSPWKNLKEFVESAKAYPNKINYSSSGVYGTLHVAMEIFANAAGIKLFHVPYQGGGPALTALLGGQVHALASGPGPAAAQMKAGKVRALASWSDQRRVQGRDGEGADAGELPRRARVPHLLGKRRRAPESGAREDRQDRGKVSLRAPCGAFSSTGRASRPGRAAGGTAAGCPPRARTGRGA